MIFSICLIEDEQKVASFIKKGLQEQGYLVAAGRDSNEGERLLNDGKYDLLILDLMLPGVNGIEFCRRLREYNSAIPILMLTALGSTSEKVTGLKAGADDYLVKPFHFDELLARIEALLRRSNAGITDNGVLSFSDLKIDLSGKIAFRAGKSIALTVKEYNLLELFLRNPNKLLSRQYIAEKVWGIGFDTGTNVIDVYVNYLRNKVDKGFPQRLIHTVIGMGYILRENED